MLQSQNEGFYRFQSTVSTSWTFAALSKLFIFYFTTGDFFSSTEYFLRGNLNLLFRSIISDIFDMYFLLQKQKGKWFSCTLPLQCNFIISLCVKFGKFILSLTLVGALVLRAIAYNRWQYGSKPLWKYWYSRYLCHSEYAPVWKTKKSLIL